MSGKIPADKIEQVRLASDIVEVVSRYLTLKKSGKNYFGICPFHKEKTPSFSVNVEKQIFHCFGCGEGGNVFNFVMRTENITFPESIRLLAKQAGIEIPEDEENLADYRHKEALFYANNLAKSFYLHNLISEKSAQKARDYLADRGIGPDLYEKYGIGYALDGWDNLIKHAKEKTVKTEVLFQAGLVLQNKEGGYYDRFRGRVTFAIHNTSGQVVGFGARRIINDNSPKYINTPETDVYQKRQVLYNLHNAREAIRENDHVIIVEGYTDITGMAMKQFNNCVATSGTALTADHAALLHRYTKNATLLFDGDSAGASAAVRGAEILMENGMDINICLLPGGQDPDEYARNNDHQTIKTFLAKAQPYVDFRLDQFKNVDKGENAAQKSDLTRDLLMTYAKVTDPIKRAYMVKELSEKLKLEESILWNEIKKMQRHVPKPITEQQAKAAPIKDPSFFSSKRGAAELGLMTSVFLFPELIPDILKNASLDLFSHPEIHDFFHHLETDKVESNNFDGTRYLSFIEDPYIARNLSQLLATDNQSDNQKSVTQYAKDCIITIQLSIVDIEIQNARKELQNGTAVNPKEVLERIQFLLQKRKEITVGSFISFN